MKARLHNHIIILYIFLFACLKFLNAESKFSEELKKGKKYFKAKEYQSALTSFSDAISMMGESQREKYEPYYYRAMIYRNIGKYTEAIEEYANCLKYRSDYSPALIEMAEVQLLIGKYDECTSNMKKYMKDFNKADDPKSVKLLAECDEAKKTYQHIKKKKGNLGEQDIDIVNRIIEMSPKFMDVRKLRLDYNLIHKKYEASIPDLVSIVNMGTNNCDYILKLAYVSLFTGDHQKGFEMVKKCLQLDQDHRTARAIYKRIKHVENDIKALEKAYKATREKLREELESGEQLLISIVGDGDAPIYSTNLTSITLTSYKKTGLNLLCLGSAKIKAHNQVFKYCDQAIETDGDNADLLVARGDSYYAEENYENAMRDYSNAFEKKRDDHIREKMRKTEEQGVSIITRSWESAALTARDATQAEIKKAFRKMTIKYHPDKAEDKDEATKKMQEINAAFEVLGDEEKRKAYDLGDDPNDPYNAQQQQHHQFFQQGGFPFGGQGGHPFGGHGGNPFGGGSPFGNGPFEFRFNF